MGTRSPAGVGATLNDIRVRREFPGQFVATNFDRDDLSREMGHNSRAPRERAANPSDARMPPCGCVPLPESRACGRARTPSALPGFRTGSGQTLSFCYFHTKVAQIPCISPCLFKCTRLRHKHHTCSHKHHGPHMVPQLPYIICCHEDFITGKRVTSVTTPSVLTPTASCRGTQSPLRRYSAHAWEQAPPFNK